MLKRRYKLVACKVERKFQLFYVSSLTVMYINIMYVCRTVTQYHDYSNGTSQSTYSCSYYICSASSDIFYRINSLLPFLIIDKKLINAACITLLHE